MRRSVTSHSQELDLRILPPSLPSSLPPSLPPSLLTSAGAPVASLLSLSSLFASRIFFHFPLAKSGAFAASSTS